ncbi:MAG TPA: hypothetical protein VH835_03975 [Dongiaceae bacterium]|jgi:hypothetical protein
MTISDLPFQGFVLFVGVAILLAVGPFILIRTYHAALLPDRSHDMAVAVGVRLGTLHGLLLALVFSVVQSEYVSQRTMVAEEAAATSKLFFNLQRFNDPAADALRLETKKYVREVIEQEWPALEHEQLSSAAWAIYDRIYDGALNLRSSTPRQEALRDRILVSLDKINEFRQARLFAAKARLPMLFWIIAVLGFLIVAALFYVFEYTRLHALMLGGYAAYTGAILYFIFVMNNPFSGPPALPPAPFELLFHGAMAELPG